MGRNVNRWMFIFFSPLSRQFYTWGLCDVKKCQNDSCRPVFGLFILVYAVWSSHFPVPQLLEDMPSEKLQDCIMCTVVAAWCHCCSVDYGYQRIA